MESRREGCSILTFFCSCLLMTSFVYAPLARNFVFVRFFDVSCDLKLSSGLKSTNKLHMV